MGASNNVQDRLIRHNNAQSLSTKGGIPWQLVHTIACNDKASAMALETKIKNRGITRYFADNNIVPVL